METNGSPRIDCVVNAGTCTTSAELATDFACAGDYLVLDCFHALQPIGVNCGSYGGSCAAIQKQQHRCINMPAGALCLDGMANCAEGLTCANGTCVAANQAPCASTPGGCPDLDFVTI